MKTNRSVFTKKTVAALFALVLTLVVTTAALAATATAKFDARGIVLGVGPGDSYNVNTRFIRTGRNHDLRLVIIRTTDEQVGGVLEPGVTSCDDYNDGDSCDKVTDLLGGTGVLSFHDSLALLTNVSILPDFFGPGVDAASGSLNGILTGDITLASPTSGTATGQTVLKINGSGVYGCFGSGLLPIPLSACEAGLGLFAPIALDVTDSGAFTMHSFTGDFSDLTFLGGKLTVTVNGPTGVSSTPIGTIQVENGRAIFKSTPSSHSAWWSHGWSFLTRHH